MHARASEYIQNQTCKSLKYIVAGYITYQFHLLNGGGKDYLEEVRGCPALAPARHRT